MSADQVKTDERLLFGTPRTGEPDSSDAVDWFPQPGARAPPRANTAGKNTWRFPRRYFIVAAVRNAFSTEAAYSTSFLFVPVLLGCGALVYFAASTEPDWFPLAAGLAIASILAYIGRARLAVKAFLLLAALVIAGALAGKFETWRADTRMLGSAVTTQLTGRVVALERQPAGRTRVTLDVIATDRPTLKYAPDRVRIVSRNLPAGVVPGALLTGRVRLMPHSGPVRPGGYDFAFHNYFRGLGAIGFFLGEPRVGTKQAVPWRSRPAVWLEQARDGLTARIKRRINGAEGEIAAALITGAKAGIPVDVNEALRRTGLAHILSISGLHMALVAGTVLATLRLTFALLPDFASRYPVRKYAAFGALLTALLYLFISGASIATQRSFLMLAVMLVALMLDRPAITMRNLAIAAIIVIVLQPHEVAGPSFQMSFAATAALVAVYGAWSARRAANAASGQSFAAPHGSFYGALKKVLLYAGALMLTSLIAGTATAIFGVWHFHRLAPLGLFANLAAMPVVSVLVMPSAVLAVVLIPFDLDGPAFALMGQGISLVVTIANWFSQRTPIDTVGMIPAASLLAASAGLVLATLPRTWLRCASIPLFAAALVFAAMRPLPDVFIDENAKMIALRQSDGSLAINRARPRVFTLDIWKRAAAAPGHAKPLKNGELANFPIHSTDFAETFSCGDELCVAGLSNGAVIAHAKTSAAARRVCDIASLIVIEDATGPRDICSAYRLDQSPAANPRILTARDLAHRGSAAVKITAGANTGTVPAADQHRHRYAVDIDYAISKPWRPWHAYRAFSREARGLPPFRRRVKKAD